MHHHVHTPIRPKKRPPSAPQIRLVQVGQACVGCAIANLHKYARVVQYPMDFLHHRCCVLVRVITTHDGVHGTLVQHAIKLPICKLDHAAAITLRVDKLMVIIGVSCRHVFYDCRRKVSVGDGGVARFCDHVELKL